MIVLLTKFVPVAMYVVMYIERIDHILKIYSNSI